MFLGDIIIGTSRGVPWVSDGIYYYDEDLKRLVLRETKKAKKAKKAKKGRPKK